MKMFDIYDGVKSQLSTSIYLFKVLVGLLIPISLVSGCTSAPETSLEKQNLENRLPYKNYSFSKAPKIIDFGDQPYWLPASIIIEVMRRDNVLADELKRLGYELKWHHFLDGNDLNYFVSKGDLEIGVGGDLPSLKIVSEEDAYIFSAFPNGSVSIVSKNIWEVEKLEGKKIGYAFGTNAHFYLLDVLQKNGIKKQSVKLIEMNVTSMANALESGDIDAYCTWEFTPPTTMKSVQDKVTTHKGISKSFLYATGDFYRNHREALQMLLSSNIRAINFLKEKDDHVKLICFWLYGELNSWGQKERPLSLGLLLQHLKQAMPGVHSKKYPRIPAKWFDEGGTLHKEFVFIKNDGFIKKNVSWKQITSRFNRKELEQIIANPGQYRLNEKINVFGGD